MSDEKKISNALDSSQMAACQVVCAVLGCGALEAEQFLVGLQVTDEMTEELQILHSEGNVDAIRSILFPPKEEATQA